MKKLHYIFASIFIAVAIISCNENEILTDDGGSGVSLKSTSSNIASTPVSDGGIIPYIIPGRNKGGNRTCEEVEVAFDAFFDLCGDKLDYEGDDYGNGSFDGEFPEGLNVTVDGNFISFEISGCIPIEGKNYKVGAVIVKGSNAANVYFYPDGTLSDGGLAAPGGLHMVSNLTFCFVECEEQPELVIALKTYITTTGQWDWATSDGEGSVDNALHIGYCEYSFNSTNIYPLIYMYSFDQIGTISASDYMENNVHYIEVVVDTYSDDWLFMDSYLYVGTLAGYNEYLTLGSNGKYITDFVSFPFQEDELSGIRVFKIPFTEITE